MLRVMAFIAQVVLGVAPFVFIMFRPEIKRIVKGRCRK